MLPLRLVVDNPHPRSGARGGCTQVRVQLAGLRVGKASRVASLRTEAGEVPSDLEVVERNPLRGMVHRRCACGHAWRAPAPGQGACPRCHGENVTNEGITVCHAKRV